MMIRHLSCLVVAALLATTPAMTSAAEIVLSGSTTVQTRVLEPLAADIKAATGIDIKVEGVGSGNGIKRLVAGEIPAAIISSNLAGILTAQNVPEPQQYQQHDIIQDVIVPVVHASNPVRELSWEQLRDIYSGNIKNWKDVGGPDLKVTVVTSHPESATREVVWELVMGKKVDYARNARIVYATKKELVQVAESPGAIGAVSKGFVDAYLSEMTKLGDAPEVKVVATANISRPLAIVTKGPPSAEMAKLISFLRTDSARAKFK